MKKVSTILTIIAILGVKTGNTAERDVSIHCDNPIFDPRSQNEYKCRLIDVKSKTEKLKISSINVNFKEQTALTGTIYSASIRGDENYPEHMPEGLGKSMDGIENFFYHFSPLKYIKRSDFKDMGSELIVLSILGNQIEDIPYDTFYDLPKIKFLTLSNNKLKKFEAGTFANLPKLISLYINNNQITELHPDLLKKLPNLSVFDAKYNQIEEVPKDLFINNPKLTLIFLNYNNLKNILVDFRHNKELTDVYLSDNYGTCDFVYYSEDPQWIPRDGDVYDINEFQDKVEKNCKQS